EPYYEDKIKDDTVLNEISKLKPKYREVILLFYYQELKVKEIVAALNITESAVTVRLSRAREQLKKSLKGWYFDE
ncbi:MAG: sigma-70 region 4 domain-containing protein, partial [Anaerovorax sp.]|nr:sigma-70 region 4 domain-containing protein [Anaerovorax sp.]